MKHDWIARKVGQRGAKYGNRKTRIGAEVFDSKREAMHYLVLRDDERSKKIRDLRRQVRFRLKVCGVLVCAYVADFVFETPDGKTTIHEVKGVKTRDYIIKAKLFRALNPKIELVEIR